MVVILTLSLVLNFLFIIGIFAYYKIMKKYSFIIDMFKPLKNNNKTSIINKEQANDFLDENISNLNAW